ncbi:MAG: hypothetical protein WD768_14345 [Phycisphaeraceae bacterium]
MKPLITIAGVLIGLAVCSALPMLYFLLAAKNYETDWSGIHEKPGPVPLVAPQKQILRLIDERKALGGETLRLYWDEGNGPVLAGDRVDQLINAIPKDLYNRVTSMRDVPSTLYAGGREGTTTYEPVYDVWRVVISLNPDVLVISVHERPIGPHLTLPAGWDFQSVDDARRTFLHQRVNPLPRMQWSTWAGTLVPWSQEMHVISTDSTIPFQRLVFEEDQATIPLDQGKLLFRRDGNDVHVSRE